MYFLVMYNLSPIQKGIQAGHAALEYAELHGKTKEYRRFIEEDKTWIILDAGGSEDTKDAMDALEEFKVPFAGFAEPDLGNCVSAVAFLVPERIYDGSSSQEIGGGCFYPDGRDMSTQDSMFYYWLKQFKLAR